MRNEERRVLLVYGCRVEAGSLGVKSQDFVLRLKEKVPMSGRVQFPKGKWDHSSS